MTTTKFKKVRLFKLAREFNVSVDALVEHITEAGNADALAGSGINASVTTEEAYEDLLNYFEDDKAQAERVSRKRAARKEAQEPEEGPVPAPAAKEAPAPVVTEEKEPEPPQEEPEPALEPAPEPALEPAPEPEPVPEPVAEKKPEPEVEVEPKVSEPAVAEEPVEEVSAEAPSEEEPVEEKAKPAAKKPMEPVGEEPPVTPVDEGEPDLIEEEEEDEEEEDDVIIPDALIPESLLAADRYKLAGTKILGKIDLGAVEDAEPGSKRKRKRKRKRIAGPAAAQEPDAAVGETSSKKAKKRKKGPQVDQTDVEQTLQETLRELEQGSSRARQRRRRQRRDERAADREREKAGKAEEETILRITEFLSTGELANLMDVSVTEVISTLFSAGMMVSINQRLDADTITFVTDEFGFDVEFITDMSSLDIEIAEDDPADLKPRAPVVTVMGHVDHGKTSLLDFIRSENVVAGEAGGITQHIGAYSVEMSDGKELTFLDTPGHEAFTAMRARGAQVTDVVILVVAADDAVMPQTVEAINHASAAGVPLVVAINKIDKPDVNTDRVMQQLADNNVLVEQWGGKVQCEMVSAMTGQGIPELLDRVLLEAELLDLKANPDRNAVCTVIESRLEKGRGNVATVLVQNGTLKVGDAFIAGIYSGRVRAMFDEREHRVEQVGPSRPALVTGLDGAPEVGDSFIVLDDEKEAREIAGHRQQIHREQSLRQRKHITLDEIGRRLALGDFQELKIIVKGDVGGSVEALSDSLLKLGSEEVAVDIIHKGVGAINESDVMLASASDAIIIGFQVRPVLGARQLAEREEIDVRLYSVIYHAIEEVRDALEGLLSPEKSESILGTAEIRETFKTPKAGTVAGCYVLDGKIRRSDRIHLIRDGVVIYEGTLSSLKRFRDDVREVQSGYECGMGIENFNDIKVGDQIEAYEIIEKRRTLDA